MRHDRQEARLGNKKWGEPGSSRDEQRQAKRQAVLLAGAKLFNDKGYEQTSLEDIAQALNITKRTIYYYVQSKEEILFACQQSGQEFLRDTLADCSDPSIPVIDRIRKLVTDYCAWVCTDIGACSPLVREVSLSPDRRAELRAGRAQLDHLLRDMIRQGIEAGVVRECDPRLMTSAVFGALNWIPYWNRTENPVPPGRIAEAYLNLIISGMVPARQV
jgi:AcrR family transcriptional regulator